MRTLKITETLESGATIEREYSSDEKESILQQFNESQALTLQWESMLSSLPITFEEQSAADSDMMDALTELGDLAADTGSSSDELMDAITELADLVASILDGKEEE